MLKYSDVSGKRRETFHDISIYLTSLLVVPLFKIFGKSQHVTLIHFIHTFCPVSQRIHGKFLQRLSNVFHTDTFIWGGCHADSKSASWVISQTAPLHLLFINVAQLLLWFSKKLYSLKLDICMSNFGSGLLTVLLKVTGAVNMFPCDARYCVIDIILRFKTSDLAKNGSQETQHRDTRQ